MNNHIVNSYFVCLLVGILSCSTIFLHYQENIFLCQLNLFICFLSTAGVSALKHRFNLLQILLLSSLLFNFLYIFANLFGLAYFPDNNLFLLGDGINHPVTEKILTYTFSYYSIFILYSGLGWYLTTPTNFSSIKNEGRSPSKFFRSKVFIWIFYIIFSLTVIAKISVFVSSQRYGYVNAIHLNPYTSKLLFPSYYTDWLYIGVSSLYLYSATTKKSFLRRSAILMIPAFIMLLSGARGYFISYLVTIFIYYNFFFGYIRYWKVILITSPLLVLLPVIGFIRFYDASLAELNQLDFFDYLFTHFLGTSTSFAVLSYTMINVDEFFNKVPFIFGYFFGIFSFEPNYKYDSLFHKSYLAQHLTYILNEEKLYRGSTIGTSQVAEIYEFTRGNLFLFALSSFIIMAFVNVIFRLSYKSPFLFYFAFLTVVNFVLSPRNSVFKVFSKELFLFSVVYFAVYLFFRSIKK